MAIPLAIAIMATPLGYGSKGELPLGARGREFPYYSYGGMPTFVLGMVLLTMPMGFKYVNRSQGLHWLSKNLQPHNFENELYDF